MQAILTLECLLFKYILPKDAVGIPIASYWFVPELLYYNYNHKEAIYIRKNILYNSHIIKSLLRNKTECAICLCIIKLDKLYTLKCKHIFHKSCINKWFKCANTCPICRGC